MVKGPGGEGRGDNGVRFDRLNELRGEAGKVLEPVERSGTGPRVSVVVTLMFVSILRPFDKLRTP